MLTCPERSRALGGSRAGPIHQTMNDHAHESMRMSTHMSVHMSAHIQMKMHVQVSIHMSVQNVCAHVCAHVYAHVYMHDHQSLHAHTCESARCKLPQLHGMHVSVLLSIRSGTKV